VRTIVMLCQGRLAQAPCLFNMLRSSAYQVIGASFIGLEVAASFRAQTIEVSVVGREPCPMEKILGANIGNSIRNLHEEHGVTFPIG
jgi:NAD(P)H-nitrite reductase large subunit